MSEQQPTKQPSGFKLYAVIVAAILTCAVVLGWQWNAIEKEGMRDSAFADVSDSFSLAY